MEKGKKRTLSAIIISFMIYAIAGWCYEVILETFIYKWGFSNRGVLFGPYCPIYGVGIFLLIFLLERFKRHKEEKFTMKLLKPLLIFVGCTLIATIVELIASYILEFATGSWPWQTYKDYKINFQGRIALSTSLRFGIGGTACIYIVQPLFDFILSKFDKKKLNIAAIIVLAVLAVDCIFSFVIF